MLKSNSLHLISFNARNWTRDLINLIIKGNLNYAFNNLSKSTNLAIANDLNYAINSLNKIINLITRSNLNYACNKGKFTLRRQNN
jgi:hypothetical protein